MFVVSKKGRRTGMDRRRNTSGGHEPERRSGKERRVRNLVDHDLGRTEENPGSLQCACWERMFLECSCWKQDARFKR